MKQIQLTIKDPDGIHARPAGILVKRMQEFSSVITVEKGDRKADCKKLFALMKLAIKQGETIVLTAEGDDEEAALAAAVTVIKETGL
ncbi:MAG: HPr family phosphocarrier protein [Fastidiosipilaceae bacterium]|jgi:phosphocarrier protein HPr